MVTIRPPWHGWFIERMKKHKFCLLVNIRFNNGFRTGDQINDEILANVWAQVKEQLSE